MNLLPYEKFEIRTRFNTQEIQSRMAETPKYKGKSIPNGFTAIRVITYRNSFLPIIKGEIQDDGRGKSIVTVTMKLHILVSVFMGIWLSFVSIFCILFLTTTSELDVPDIFQYVLPFAMLVFGLVLTYVPFKVEAKKSKRDLLCILEGDLVQVDNYR